MTAATTERSTQAAGEASESKLQWGSALLGLIGLLFTVSGLSSVYRGLVTKRFEPGVEALGGVGPSELAASNPELASYVAHLHVNGGALAALLGVAIVVLVVFGVRHGYRWSLATTVVLPVVYLAFLVVMHTTAAFPYHALEHLGAVAIGLPLLVLGALLSWLGMSEADTAPDGPTSGGGRA